MWIVWLGLSSTRSGCLLLDCSRSVSGCLPAAALTTRFSLLRRRSGSCHSTVSWGLRWKATPITCRVSLSSLLLLLLILHFRAMFVSCWSNRKYPVLSRCWIIPFWRITALIIDVLTHSCRDTFTEHALFLPLTCVSVIITFYQLDAMLVRVLCLSVTSLCSIETDERIELVFDILALQLHSTYPTLCDKEVHVPSKIRVLSCGILLQTLDLENFATAYRLSKRVINLARERQTLRPW